ncbi:MAG: NUDIX hydrolase [Candidatus Dojkabacteria bacterium]|nr:NUDIX hydrolase [Candidatus Dojkabacteria bacterium]
MDQFSQGIEVVTTAFIKKGNQFLLAKANNSDTWFPVVGHIEPGEKILDACKREVEEEVGLRIQPAKIIDFGEAILKKSHFIYFIILFELHEGKDVKAEEGELEFNWFSIEEALELNIAEIFRDTVKSFKKYLH